jgi:Skp family chaperone for outer membrane proteins
MIGRVRFRFRTKPGCHWVSCWPDVIPAKAVARARANSKRGGTTMTRKVGFVALIVVVGAAGYIGSLWGNATHSWERARPTSRIAVFNLPMVIKKYKKYENYEKELQTFVKVYQDREAKMRETLAKLKENGETDTGKLAIKKEENKLEELSLEFKNALAKKTDAELIVLYSEVEQMVTRVAQANGFEMVFSYGDVLEKKDAHNPMVIQKKVFGGMFVPMYTVKGLDITVQIYEELNKQYARGAKPFPEEKARR